MLCTFFRRLPLAASLVVLLVLSLSSAAPHAQAKSLASTFTHYDVGLSATTPSTILGVSASLELWRPIVQSGDLESLAQIAVIQTLDLFGQHFLWRDIEFGWVVSPSAYGGSPDPHLFVFVRDIRKYGLNGCLVQEDASSSTGWACGFVRTFNSFNSAFPGEDIRIGGFGGVPLGSAITFQIIFSGGNWHLFYSGTEIGYIPESAFSGSFHSVSVANWQGEVAVANQPPTTQMGNGTCGTKTGSAHFYSMDVETATSTFPASTYHPTSEITNKRFYNGLPSKSPSTGSTLAYGGPNGCP